MPASRVLLLAFALAALVAEGTGLRAIQGYVPAAAGAHRPARMMAYRTEPTGTELPAGAEIGGFLSPRGLPPRAGRFIVTDSGLVFFSSDGRLAQTYPLVGPVRVREGWRRRAPMVTLAYADSARERPAYVFRVDGGVFVTDAPGPLLDVVQRPRWLDSLASRQGRPDRTLASLKDTAGIWYVTRAIERSAYADTLYALFGRPARAVGVVSSIGRRAGRLGEYIASRDSLAIDPARMSSEEQLRHAITHELAHRWQARAPAQLRTLWEGVAPIRDTRRYGYGKTSEHQAEAVAFAVHFLQTNAASMDAVAQASLEQYELLVPGTGAMARYLALQPIYAGHPLRRILTTGAPD